MNSIYQVFDKGSGQTFKLNPQTWLVIVPCFKKFTTDSVISPATESSLLHNISLTFSAIKIYLSLVSYLVTFPDGKPSFYDLAIDKMLSRDVHNTNNFSVSMVFVPDIKDQAVSLMTNFNLESFIPNRIETVVNDSSLGNSGLAKLHINKGISDILLVIQLTVPVFHVRDVSEN